MSKQMESVYRQAAAILRKRGWTQGTFGRASDGPVCMAGAMSMAKTHGVFTTRYFADPQATIGLVCGGAVSNFNDEHCKTVDDAIAALEIAADIEACS